MPMTTPTTMSIVAVIRRSRNGPSIWSLSVRPSTPMGMEPTMTSQPIWASWFRRISLFVSERNHAARIRPTSLRK